MALWTPADLAVPPKGWAQDGSTTQLGSGSTYGAGPWATPPNNVNTLNGYPVLTYTSGKGLQSTSADSWASGSNYVCAVIRRATGQVDYQPIVETDQDRGNDAMGTMYASAGDGAYLFGYGTGYNGSPPIGGTDANTPCATDGLWHVIEFLLGSTYYVKVDGYNLTASGPSTGAVASRSTKTNIGHNGDGEQFIGDIVAWVVCDYNPAEADKIRGSLIWRYGLQASLPPTDPYFLAPPMTGITLTGQSATGSRGTLTPSNSLALIGKVGTGAIGSLTPSRAKALTGFVGTGAQGSLTPSRTVALTGLSATGAIGTLSAGSPTSAALTGKQATGAGGALSVSVTVALTGVAASGQTGSIGSSRSAALTGKTATAAKGLLGLGARSIVVTGQQAAGQIGVLTPPMNVTVALTGLGAVGLIGVMSPGGGLPISRTAFVGPIGSRIANISGVTRTAAVTGYGARVVRGGG